MAARDPEIERDLQRFKSGWMKDAERLLSILKSKADDDPAFCGTPGRQGIAQQLIKEAAYFLEFAPQFSSDWPEYQEIAVQLQQLIDETRELIG